MELFIISSIEQLEQYRDDWSSILEENQNTNPFIEFEWINEWWKHLGGNKQIEIMGIRKDEEIIAFFPFLYDKGLLGYKYFFMSFGQANYMDVVAYHDMLDDSLKFVLDEIIHEKKNVVFYLHGLLESSITPASLEMYLQSRNSKFSVHRVITPYIDLKKITLEEYMEKRQRLHRLDRREKRLHENGNVEFLRSSPEEMDYIFKLHDKRWEKRRDTSGFTNEKEKEFYRSLAKITSGSLKTQIDSLYINDTMIAFNYGFNCRGRYLGYVLGYDDDFETFSPGRILEKEKILQCKYGNERVFDLSIGYETYKFEWNTHLDYTRRMIFSSNTIAAKVIRNWLSMKETFIERIKENHKLVLFKRKNIGKLVFIIKNIFKTESKGARSEVIEFFKRIRKYFYENERYLVYKMEKKNVPDLPDSEEFIELTINDAMKSSEIVSIHMKDICRKMYGGYKGYYPKDNLAYENIFWTNDKVLRIDRISYLEQFKKSSVHFKNWNEGNLSAICSSVKKNSKARTVYVAIEEGAKTEKALLEEVGFSISKHIFKKTYFGFKKYHVTE
ncbi:GNAT family N-acetyltransferase [Sporosarcina sp. Marseille-Q4063]|uniref:GNAT family N-acetyltransferase n=1 Tax=Sporosarcina sp. Marseille-Q4063 TaxID=2810514 RepID=UPI001BAFDE84|nr:GNAT family N-acetyltransferase [Sporosarcina sp. Marseille-Q4063]QUW23292.1 GNAT family N-acetyltransferase [Sporosarcina sp. Marseille-Q4063]